MSLLSLFNNLICPRWINVSLWVLIAIWDCFMCFKLARNGIRICCLLFKIYRSFFHIINRKWCALYLHLMRKTICRKDSDYEDVKTLRTQITVAWLTVNTTVNCSFVLVVLSLQQSAIHSKCKWEGFWVWSGNVWAECTGSFSS